MQTKHTLSLISLAQPNNWVGCGYRSEGRNPVLGVRTM